MWLDRAGKLSNIGSFLLAVYIVLRPVGVGAMMLSSPLVWVFWAGLILAAYLHFAASSVHVKSAKIKTSETSWSEQSPALKLVPSAAMPPMLPTPKVEERIFVGPDVTPQSLVKIFEGRTDFQANTLVQLYIGKWMEVFGPIADIFSGEGPCVALERSAYDSVLVMLRFRANWRERLSILNVGNELRVVGKIESVAYRVLTLGDCEIIIPLQR